MASGVMPPTGSNHRSLGSTARCLEDVRRQRLGREQLEGIGAGLKYGERLGQGRDPGDAQQAFGLGRADDRGLVVRHHDQATAGGRDRFDRRQLQHRAGADQRPLAERFGQALDARERLGQLSGTSSATKPTSIRTSPIGIASSGRMPRRIAISGKRQLLLAARSSDQARCLGDLQLAARAGVRMPGPRAKTCRLDREPIACRAQDRRSR